MSDYHVCIVQNCYNTDNVCSAKAPSHYQEIPFSELQLHQRIGVGSYGEVYSATWLHSTVAVKLMLAHHLGDDIVALFREEIRIMR